MQALCLPLGASISLLIMFFFFDSLSILFAFVTASKSELILKSRIRIETTKYYVAFSNSLCFLSPVVASISLSFLLLPVCQYILRLCIKNKKMKIAAIGCNRFSLPEIVSFTLSVTIVCVWILTGHWLLMDGKTKLVKRIF